MRTFITDASTNDLLLDKSGNIAMAKSNIEVAKQLSRNYLLTFIGEIFTDQSVGTKWFDIMLNDFVGLNGKIAELKRVLLTVPFIEGVEEVKYSQDKESGTITFEITIKTEYGTIKLDDITVGG
jgi:hypothetical protein